MRNTLGICLAGRFGIALVLALFCNSFSYITTFAQTAEESVEEEAAPAIDIATVTVDGEDLFSIVGVSARPAGERAADVAQRIEEVAESGLSAPSLIVQDTEFGPAIYIDGVYITTVTQVDVEHEGLDAPTLAKRIGDRIIEEIEAYRNRRSEAGITASLITAISWTLAFLAFGVALAFGARYLRKRADQRTVAWVQRVENSTGKIVKTDTIVSTTRATIWTVAFLIFVIALYYYLSQILFAFAETRGIAVVLLEYFTGPVFHIVWLIVGEIPDLIIHHPVSSENSEAGFPEHRTRHYQNQRFRARLDLADLPHRECGLGYLCRCRGLSLHSRVRNGSFQGDHHFSRDHPFLGFQLGHIEPALRVVCHLSA
jgi:hypothetical protein